MQQSKSLHNPMNIVDYLSTMFSMKGNAFGFTALGLETTGFLVNPTLETGLIPIITGIGLWLVSLWQKTKSEKRADELHKEQLKIKEAELEAAKIQNEILRQQLQGT